MESDSLNVALVEFSPVWEDPQTNTAALDDVFAGLFSGGVPSAPDMVVLPEFFSAGFTMNPDAAEKACASPTLEWMVRTADRYGCAVTGSVPVIGPGSARYNRLYFAVPGRPAGVYDKAHLFFGGEQENYIPGNGRKIFEFKGWRILPGICFDLRFPECIRNSGCGQLADSTQCGCRYSSEGKINRECMLVPVLQQDRLRSASGIQRQFCCHRLSWKKQGKAFYRMRCPCGLRSA